MNATRHHQQASFQSRSLECPSMRDLSQWQDPKQRLQSIGHHARAAYNRAARMQAASDLAFRRIGDALRSCEDLPPDHRSWFQSSSTRALQCMSMGDLEGGCSLLEEISARATEGSSRPSDP